jgi:hypothetical protein
MIYALSFLLHQVLSTIGTMILTAFLAFSMSPVVQPFFDSTITAHKVSVALTETPGFPLQVVFGFLSGMAMSYWLKQRQAQWVWVFPLTVLACALFWLPISALEWGPLARAEHFFGRGCQPRNHCFDQMMFTLPAIAAISYSLGTFFGLRLVNRSLFPSGGPWDGQDKEPAI